MDGTINVFIHGLEGKTMCILLKKDSTVDELFQKANEKTGIPLAEMRLISGGRQLQQGQDKVLADYNIQNLSTVMMVLRLRGGADNGPTLTPLPGFISLTTTGEDMISLDADPGTPKAVMPCGHVIGQESMKSYCESLLSDGKSAFRCPHVDSNTSKQCPTMWDFHLVSHVAGLSPVDKERFGSMMASNYLSKQPGIRQCSRCSSWCERSDCSQQRVVCPFCTRNNQAYQFCWVCLGEWSALDHSYCGLNQKQKYLATCGTKTIVGVANCPAARACLKCGVLIEHIDACKHMHCKGCNENFCFICLKPAINGNYQCGAHNTPCVPAPRQTHIPGE